MQIDTPTPAEHTEFLALVDAEIRPHRAKTHAWDDFSLILHADNRACTLVARSPEGVMAGGIATLIREFTTNYGNIAVAGIGSVVTRAEFRGQGISRALQNAMLAFLQEQDVPLAVLWTNQPEIYAGRGFVPAGWEFHLDLAEARLPALTPGVGNVRLVTEADLEVVQAWYQRHPCRTVRHPDDAKRLYLMPGTTGLVLEKSSRDVDHGLCGAVFCGKGADFPSYVLEFDGAQDAVLPLLSEARRRKLARYILIPAGEEAFAETLVNLGAGGEIRSSGMWRVLDPERLTAMVPQAHDPAGPSSEDPRLWLGGVSEEGQIQPGILKLGVWGFDSV